MIHCSNRVIHNPLQLTIWLYKTLQSMLNSLSPEHLWSWFPPILSVPNLHTLKMHFPSIVVVSLLVMAGLSAAVVSTWLVAWSQADQWPTRCLFVACTCITSFAAGLMSCWHLPTFFHSSIDRSYVLLVLQYSFNLSLTAAHMLLLLSLYVVQCFPASLVVCWHTLVCFHS